jgi:hypothetical protein
LTAFNIQGLPDDLKPGVVYDARILNVRWVPTRDGDTIIVFETEYRGPHDEANPGLITFVKSDTGVEKTRWTGVRREMQRDPSKW